MQHLVSTLPQRILNFGRQFLQGQVVRRDNRPLHCESFAHHISGLLQDLRNALTLGKLAMESDSPEARAPAVILTTPHCFAMEELPNAGEERARLQADPSLASSSSLYFHLSQGLAYTTGSALGSTPPPQAACLAAFVLPNKVGLTAGARAWSKHAHRSGGPDVEEGDRFTDGKKKKKVVVPSGWWGTPSGPVASINERALDLFWRVTNATSWRNLHWLPHCVLVYEIRVPEGYGMRWSQDQSGFVEPGSGKVIEGKGEDLKERPWIFRGFVEPMMENGHEVGWRH